MSSIANYYVGMILVYPCQLPALSLSCMGQCPYATSHCFRKTEIRQQFYATFDWLLGLKEALLAFLVRRKESIKIKLGDLLSACDSMIIRCEKHFSVFSSMNMSS